MTPDEQRELVLEHLARRERIADETRQQLAERTKDQSLDPLADIPPEVRQAAEDEYHERQGKKRYTTSDGRILFLTPEEIAQRRRAKSRKQRGKPRYYGLRTSDLKRDRFNLLFNGLAIVLALTVVYLILH